MPGQIPLWSSFCTIKISEDHGQFVARYWKVCIYLDDILITGATEVEHLHNLYTGSTESLRASRCVLKEKQVCVFPFLGGIPGSSNFSEEPPPYQGVSACYCGSSIPRSKCMLLWKLHSTLPLVLVNPLLSYYLVKGHDHILIFYTLIWHPMWNTSRNCKSKGIIWSTYNCTSVCSRWHCVCV